MRIQPIPVPNIIMQWIYAHNGIDIAKKLNISKSAVSRMKKNKRANACYVKKIAEIMGLSQPFINSIKIEIYKNKRPRVQLPIGKRYGYLTVIENIKIAEGLSKVRCNCDCGGVWVGLPAKIKNRHVQSCGCKKNPTRHGMSKTRLYSVWQGMKNRCEEPKNISYRNYGARGIKVCQEWQSSDAFLKWAKNNGYKQGLQIDRIDNDGDYEPQNCHFVTPLKNAQNTRKNKNITINGITRSVSAWSRKAGISFACLHNRIKNNWPQNKLLTPSRRQK